MRKPTEHSFDISRAGPVRSAMYVRMSTDGQNYSIDLQRAGIQEYALLTGLQIVREYADEGKSGLDLKRRAGLQALICDVQSGRADYSVIIVYDVSRWGRFQDIDEAAYHEHTCRRAGIQVEYCAEQFANDGSAFGSLLKSIKRTMAAEYSRDLSMKVFAAQCRFITLGFKQGGTAGYGLRRVAVTDEGVPRRTLAFKERKSATTDRVVLVRGPESEVAVVQRIYSLYLEKGLGDAGIARLLNEEGIPSEFGRKWTCWLVATILTNRKYAGSLVFNKRSSKMQQKSGPNSPDAWIVKENVIDKVVSYELFHDAQVERKRRLRPHESGELLEMIRSCYRKHGRVSQRLIADDPALPDPETFARCFGSLVAAYDFAGIPRTRNFRFIETKQLMKRIRDATFARACTLIPKAGGTLEVDFIASTIIINGNVRVRVDTATSRDLDRETLYWKVLPRPGADFILSARLDFENRKVLDYFLIPASEFSTKPIYLRPSKPDRFDRLRYPTLEAVFGLENPS